MRILDDDIKNGQLKPVYMLYGDEAWLMEEALAALSAAVAPAAGEWSREIFDGHTASPGEVAAAALEGSLFGGARLVVAKNISWLDSKSGAAITAAGKKKAAKQQAARQQAADAPELQADETAPLLAYLQDPNPATCLVLTARGQVDKRRKLVQLIQKQGRLLECATPKAAERDIWLAQRLAAAGYQADKRAIAYISVSAANLSQMAAEAQKLMLYCADTRRISLADAQAVVAKSSLNSIFELTDAAAAKNARQALDIYRQLLRQGEEEQKIFAMLAAQFRNLLLVQDLAQQGLRPPEIARELSLHPYVVEKCDRACRAFSQRQLIKTLEMLLAADLAQKSGRGEMTLLLENVILRICAFS